MLETVFQTYITQGISVDILKRVSLIVYVHLYGRLESLNRTHLACSLSFWPLPRPSYLYLLCLDRNTNLLEDCKNRSNNHDLDLEQAKKEYRFARANLINVKTRTSDIFDVFIQRGTKSVSFAGLC